MAACVWHHPHAGVPDTLYCELVELVQNWHGKAWS